jgi:ppGpp synthetase/RelA/SpoT-type nucleotidyltranferase
MKEQIRIMAAEGASPKQIVLSYREQLNELAALRMELQRQLLELRKANKMEEAQAFVETANQILEPYGARPFVLYPKRNPQP